MTTELPTEKELWAAMPKSVFWKTQPTENFVGTMNDIPTHENTYCYPRIEMGRWTRDYRRFVRENIGAILQEIVKAQGKFDLDPHKRCHNTVTDMRELARDALTLLGVKIPEEGRQG